MLKDRIKQARKLSTLSQDEVAKAVGITQSAYSQIEGGKSASTSFIAQLARVLKVNAEWLATGEGEMEESRSGDAMPHYRSVDQSSRVQVLSWEQIAKHDWNAQPEYETIPGGLATAQSRAVKMEGDSMCSPGNRQSIPDGALIIFDVIQSPKIGDIVIARMKDGSRATCKKYVIDDGQHYLKPLNPHPSYSLEQLDNKWHIEGVVHCAFITNSLKQ